MGDVLTFTPRPKPVAPAILAPLAGHALRVSLEEAAQTALDAADRIIAVLDSLDGDADHEDGGDAEPSLAAPANAEGSQVVYMRGNDQDREIETPDALLPKMETQALPAAPILPWRGRGNVIAAAGVTLLDLMAGRNRCSNLPPSHRKQAASCLRLREERSQPLRELAGLNLSRSARLRP